jgi:hypothetical protein
MRTTWIAALALCATLLGTETASAQYNQGAGENRQRERDAQGRVVHDETGRAMPTQAPNDGFGNVQGNQFDLAVDGAFEGQTIAVLHLYTQEGFDFHLPKAALAEKGFSVYRWVNGPPSPQELTIALEKACQLWVISSSERLLTDEHIAVIKAFFDAGHGVYIWGDNEPYYADANAVAAALFGTTMTGNLLGNQVVPISTGAGKPGIIEGHLLTTGLEFLYEGITIATLAPTESLTPLVYGSAGNLVTAFYDHDGKRAILDGGFTRLYCNWDTAGTARYVKNAAAWLVNVERFGETVIAPHDD